MSLAEKSLLRAGGATLRFRMLRTIREFAADELRSHGEEATTRRALVSWVDELARQAAPQLLGPDQQAWIRRLKQEDETVRDTVEWCYEHDQSGAATRIVSLLVDYWDIVGPYESVYRWLERGVADTSDLASEWDARANIALSFMALLIGELETARRAAERAVVITQPLDDHQLCARALHTLAAVCVAEDDYDQTAIVAEQALAEAKAAADQTMTAFSLNCLGIAAYEHDDPDAAYRYFSEATDHLRAAGDRRNTGIVISNLGIAALLSGEEEAAAETFQQAIDLSEELGEQGRLPGMRVDLAITRVLQRRPDDAASALALALPDALSVGDYRGLVSAVIAAACITSLRGDDLTAGFLYGSAKAYADDHGFEIEAQGPDRLMWQRLLVPAAGRLGQAAWSAALLRGRTVTLRDAATRALDVVLDVAQERASPN